MAIANAACSVLVAGALSSPICDLDPLYNSEFTYSLPRPILSSFFDGKAFDHKESYSPSERACLEKDVDILYHKILGKDPLKQRTIVITAGAPGAGKTVLMKQDLARQSALMGRDIAYIDPDDVCLKKMDCTYQEDLRKALADLDKFTIDEERVAAERVIRQELYNKWRPGSNGANHYILAHLIRLGCALYFGSTSTSPQTATFFEFLKKQGYSIRLLHVTASDDVRWGSVVERDKQFVQTTEADIRDKGKMFPQRLSDTYFKHAKEIGFYYRPAVGQDAILAAEWRQGMIEVLDASAYEKIQSIHNETCRELKQEGLLWDRVFP